tara:strand:+ start:482 stop:961 length:480 start_codon:yes stop_codon:yes gene_type:complete
MKITKSQLKQIIKEELEGVLGEGGCGAPDPAQQLADQLGIDAAELASAMAQMGLELSPGQVSSLGGSEDPYDKYSMEDEEFEMPMMEADRTAKGNITQDAREKNATVGKDKFPIFDKESAESAIKLRGHASKANQKKIINKAAKYAPAAAKKARKADKK